MTMQFTPFLKDTPSLMKKQDSNIITGAQLPPPFQEPEHIVNFIPEDRKFKFSVASLIEDVLKTQENSKDLDLFHIPIEIDQNLFRILVGTIVIFAGLFLSLYIPKSQVNSRFLEANGGLFAGLMNGAFAIPGPPIIIYAMFAEPEPNRSRAMLMQFFAAAALLGFLSFSFTGMIHRELISIFLLCMPVMVLGNYIGNTFFEKHGDSSYRSVTIFSSILIGIVTIASVLIMDSE